MYQLTAYGLKSADFHHPQLRVTCWSAYLMSDCEPVCSKRVEHACSNAGKLSHAHSQPCADMLLAWKLLTVSKDTKLTKVNLWGISVKMFIINLIRH